MTTDEQHQRAYRKAVAAGDMEAAKYIASQIKGPTDAELGAAGAEGMDKWDKTLANVGAGLHSAWTGAKQITPGMKSPTDAEVRDKRAMDTALAKSTETGAGSDWMPSVGTALQFVGEMLPAAVVPAGAMTGMGARMLPRAIQATLRSPVGSGVVAGATGGALMPTLSDESRAANVVLGAAGGAALPLAVKAVRGARDVWGANRRAGRQLREGLGDQADDVIAATSARQAERAGQAAAVRAIPESAAEASGSTALARIEAELGRAPETQDVMSQFRRGQNEARFEAVQDATRDATQAVPRMDARAQITDPMRVRALAASGQDPWFHLPAVEAIQRIRASDSAVNPAVRKVADYVDSIIGERAATAVTPGRLYEARKVLVDLLEGPARLGDDMSSAVKGAQRETMEMIRGIDDALNQSSGGQFGRYKDTFRQASRGVDEAEAAQLARQSFQRDTIKEIGGSPEVSVGTLSRARAAAAGDASRQFPLRLSPSATQKTDDILAHLKRANEVQTTRKLAGTGGGGSQSSMDLEGVIKGLGGKAGIPLISPVIEGMAGAISASTRRELAQLMQNPQAAMQALQAARIRNQPLSEAQRAFLQITGAGAGTGAPALMQSQ